MTNKSCLNCNKPLDKENKKFCNKSCQREFEYRGVFFREGDRVMQTRNNYDMPWEKEDEEGCVTQSGL